MVVVESCKDQEKCLEKNIWAVVGKEKIIASTGLAIYFLKWF